MKKLNLLLCLSALFTGLTLECHAAGILAKEKQFPISTEGKTFQVLLDKALFLKRPRVEYTAFTDSEINVVKVTNLNITGQGSFAWAINQNGPKIVVFEVGGVIDLDSTTLIMNKPFTYVAGQTAPYPGITIVKGQITIKKTHDIIFEHIAIRPGDLGLRSTDSLKKWEADGLSVDEGYNVLVDHCSFTWGTDENLSVTGYVHLGPERTSHCITFSNNLIAEGLYDSAHPKGPHSMGTLIHNNCRDIALVGNLYAHNYDRNPALKPKATVYIANNLLYNVNATIMSYWDLPEYANYPGTMSAAEATIIGNVLIPGENTPAQREMIRGSSGGGGIPDTVKTFFVYNLDNEVLRRKNPGDNPIINNRVRQLTQKPIDTDWYIPIKSCAVYKSVLKNVGARPKYRDDIDKRIVESVRNLKGKIIDSQREVGGYPNEHEDYKDTTHVLQVPATGIEAWLASKSRELIND